MPFAYYDRLSERGKAIYRRSNAVPTVPLAQPELLRPFVGALRDALARDDRKGVEQASGFLCRGITEMLGVPEVQLAVLPTRPRSRSGELHGLYQADDGAPPRIKVWMRTAAHGRVVAFRTFLRTLLHEVVHHLDYRLLRLGAGGSVRGVTSSPPSSRRRSRPPAGRGPRCRPSASRRGPRRPPCPARRPRPRS